MNRAIAPEVISTIAALGFDVYQSTSPAWRSYLFFTDGTRVAYMQTEFGALTLSTVHLPCRECGTGFRLDNPAALTREELERGFIIAPNWASATDRAAVRKYADAAAFLKSRGNSDLELVAKGVR